MKSPTAAGLLKGVGMLALAFMLGTPVCHAAEASLGKGDKLAELQVGGRTYLNVEIRSISARTLTVLHEGGLVSVPLKNLGPEMQRRLGYDPARDAAAERQLELARRQREQENARQTAAREAAQGLGGRRYELLIQGFVNAPELRHEVDLRSRFFALELGVKRQGRRPSCSVFAVVSAVEYLNSEVAGRPEALSEEYLIWATRRLVSGVSRNASPVPAEETGATEDDLDTGFALGEVLAALRGFGIPLQSSMPNTFGSSMDQIKDPPEAVVLEARQRRRVFIHPIPGRDRQSALANIIHILNAGIPVPVGMRWPHYNTLRTGFISEQLPIQGYAHAVALVGYRCPTGKLEDVEFIFRNSYGAQWGQGGYGVVTFAYLSKWLMDAALIEVQSP